MARPRVLAVASHPIQYHAPWFRGLAASQDIDFSVLFVQVPNAQQQGHGFGIAFEWDVPLLEGYEWRQAGPLHGRGGLQGFFAARLPDADALLAELAPDVMISTGWHTWPLVQLTRAAARRRIPVLMRAEANALRARSWKARLAHRWLLRKCAAFLPIGRANRDFYRNYGIADDTMFDAPYFIDNERFARAAADALPRRDEWRAKWSIPAASVCFCFAGKLEPKKRVLDLVDALRIACASRDDLHLLVVGTGAQEREARARSEGLPVSFAGFLNQTEIPAAYVASDALVLPSDFGETWGLVVNEAMACGRPAIVSDRVGCGPDLVQAGRTGAVFPFGDTHALAQQLIAFAGDRDRLAAMGESARERVVGHYDVRHAVEGTLHAVRHVTAGR